MPVPLATYRLQFREGMDFDRAAGITPYLKALGISHLYASPIFTATAGSTHGYDVTDHNEIDPSLGGREGFDRLSAALKDAGLGLILDIVPNHMAASPENPWWRDVIEWGEDSAYARHFDIDWSRRLTLPILGKPIEESIADGDVAVIADRKAGNLALACPGHALPLHPSTYQMVLADAGSGAGKAVLEAAEEANRAGTGAMHDRIRRVLADDAACADMSTALAQCSKDKTFLARLHDAQPWQLMFWQRARSELSYRRFFEITGLAGLRVEDDAVFDDAHRLSLELVRSGQVDGLRIDHVDGLADPKGYLERLRSEAGPDTYIVVEKILERGEALPGDWPVEGATGYEFVDMAAGLFTDVDGGRKIDAAYAGVTGKPSDIPAMAREAKMRMVTYNFDAELSGLTAIASGAGNTGLTAEDIRTAIAELVTAFPVYRTYGRPHGLDAHDRSLLHEVADAARGRCKQPVRDAIGHVVGLLEDTGTPEFRTRFQQLTGPVMAKAVEDTLFYRFNRLIALNEVGGDPEFTSGGVASFHARMSQRAKAQPRAMTGTATHDTKRGEDARMRLLALTEAAGGWIDAVARWRSMHANRVQTLDEGPAPEPETEWLLYQALAGVWPSGGRPDETALQALTDRFMPYLEKAMREAKRRTGWLSVDEGYESAVKDYAAQLLSPENEAFLDDFTTTVRPYVRAGRLNSLSQTLIKLTAPGIPDIYQGTELQDFSLVDPDNRRPVDFELAEMALWGARSDASVEICGLSKQGLIRSCLAHRRERARLFTHGDYRELTLSGPKAANAVAFMRCTDEDAVIVIAPRLSLSLSRADTYDASQWSDTEVRLPDDLAGASMREVLNGVDFTAGQSIPLSTVLTNTPFGLIFLNEQGA